MATDSALTVRVEPTTYTVRLVPDEVGDAYLWDIEVQRRGGFDGERWAVVMRSWVFDHVNDEWVCDPIPSSRTPEHLAACRYLNLDVALAAAERLAPDVVINGVTAAARADSWCSR